MSFANGYSLQGLASSEPQDIGALESGQHNLMYKDAARWLKRAISLVKRGATGGRNQARKVSEGKLYLSQQLLGPSEMEALIAPEGLAQGTRPGGLA